MAKKCQGCEHQKARAEGFLARLKEEEKKDAKHRSEKVELGNALSLILDFSEKYGWRRKTF